MVATGKGHLLHYRIIPFESRTLHRCNCILAVEPNAIDTKVETVSSTDTNRSKDQSPVSVQVSFVCRIFVLVTGFIRTSI